MTTAAGSIKAKNPSVFAASRSLADVDLVRSYLRDIGRVPLLSHEQEITLGRQVQDLMVLENIESELRSDLGDQPEIDLLSFVKPTTKNCKDQSSKLRLPSL